MRLGCSFILSNQGQLSQEHGWRTDIVLPDPTLRPDWVEAAGSGRRSARIAPLLRVTLEPRPGGRRPLRPLECPAPQSLAVPTPPPAHTCRDSGQSRPWYQWPDSRVRSSCRAA